MARRPWTSPAPPDSADTESWLVEGLFSDDAERAPRPRETPRPPRKEDREPEQPGPERDHKADDPANGVPALRRDLARATVEFDRVRAELAETEVRLRTTLIDEVRAHARALDRKQKAMSDALGAFSARLDELEERLGSLDRDSEAVKESPSVLDRHPRDEPAKKRVIETLDLNAASFEELRGIGLSVTQAKRVLRHRDRLGGFDSVARLREVPGLPAEILQRIQTQTHV